MDRSLSALELPKLAGAPGQARQFKRAGVLLWRQGGGDKIPSGWRFGGKGPDLALPGHAAAQSMPINGVDSYSGVLELVGTCGGPGSSSCPMGAFVNGWASCRQGQGDLGFPHKKPRPVAGV